jgi:ectoine hydroxylase-related dioxygenase (phytanoyl-CoA dioxygenase family)
MPWHQNTSLPLRERRDMASWGPWSIKDGVTYAHAPAEALARVIALRIHLDDSRHDNGSLRVLPGTHTAGLLSDAAMSQLSREVQPVDCVVPAGGVVAMRPLLVHASSKSQTADPRRVLHIEYADTLDIAPGLMLAVS